MSDNHSQPWWRGAAIYQVYPRSFLDSIGDGVGDLAGITGKLEYIRSLGVDGLWVSPFFTSPQDDFGYDVADYLDVDPIFGSLADFDCLIARSHDLGLKLIIDQVYSHTSSRHPWFELSRSDKNNAKSDWYVWADAKADGSAPNNWLSVFGGPAWTWDARRRQYYLHNFLASQPDLNLHHRDVQNALLAVARFWLDRGIDGIRLDAINYGFHNPALDDNPPAPPAVRGEASPWQMQLKTHNSNRREVPAFLERLNRLARRYGDILTIAEVGGVDPTPVMLDYTRGADRLSTAYGFDFLSATAPTAQLVRAAFEAWPADPRMGWPAWAFSNHDAPRVASRWDIPAAPQRRTRLFALLLASLRGNLFVYQGEELGLTQAQVPFENLRDPEGIANWPHSLGRDGARTPMPWQRDADQGGFTSGQPWLPVDPSHLPMAIDVQDGDPDSNLTYFRTLLALRRSSPSLRHGDLALLEAPDQVLAFVRRSPTERALCVFNLDEQAVQWSPPADCSARVSVSAGLNDAKCPTELAGWAGYIAIAPA